MGINMKLHLENKTALISGSTKGIGFAIALQMAMEGVHVIVGLDLSLTQKLFTL
jgi:NAD(P)-dependent dehydrogenase (short-subunit alcohol dehydrogenase family)